MAALVSCCLSAAGIRFLGSCPARGFRPSCDRPTAPPEAARTRAGFPCSARVRRGRGRAPSVPRGTAVPARPRVNPAAAACRLATAGPCHPGVTTRPGMFSSRGISKGSLSFAPPGHSPHLSPPDGTGALGLFPGLHTRLSRTQPRMPGRDEPQALARGHVVAISDLLQLTHSTRATSCRNAPGK